MSELYRNIPVLEPRVEPDEGDIAYFENIRLAPQYIYAADLKTLAAAYLGERQSAETPTMSVGYVDAKRLLLQTLLKESDNQTAYRLRSVEIDTGNDRLKMSDQDFTHVAKFYKKDLRNINTDFSPKNIAMCLPFDENKFADHVEIEHFIDDLQTGLIERTCRPITVDEYTDPQEGRNDFVRRFVTTVSLHKDAMDGAHINLGANTLEIFKALRAAGLSEIKTGKKKVLDALVPHPSGFPVCEPDDPVELSNDLYLTRKEERSSLSNRNESYYQLSFHKPQKTSKG